MVTLGQLWARRELALEIAVDPPGAREKEVTIVHSSEPPEVDEWLAGGEVLLTIGVGQDLTAPSAGDYIARLTRVGVHALGIGLGGDLPRSSRRPRSSGMLRNTGSRSSACPNPCRSSPSSTPSRGCARRRRTARSPEPRARVAGSPPRSPAPVPPISSPTSPTPSAARSSSSPRPGGG